MKSIIFIPGIEATALANVNSFDFNLLWNAFDTLGSSASSSLLGPYIEEGLQLEPIYDQDDNVIIERNHIARLPYESSLLNLRKKLGANIYIFGYDWRLSNVENGKRLKTYFYYLRKKLKKKNADNEFYFLTHSMGGLLFLNFVNELADADFTNIKKVILAAPPLLGSPYALIHMIKGDGGVKSFFNHIFGRNEDVRKIMRTFPSVYELLPSYPNAITYTDGTPVNLLDTNQWQSNISESDPESSEIFENRVATLTEYRYISYERFHQYLTNKTIIVVGEGDDTSTWLAVSRQEESIRNFVLLDSVKIGYKSGDGTVPFISSTAYKNSIPTLAVKKENFFEQSADLSFHGLFLRDSRVQNIITRYFADNAYYNTNNSNIQNLFSIGGGVRLVDPNSEINPPLPQNPTPVWTPPSNVGKTRNIEVKANLANGTKEAEAYQDETK